MPSWLCAVLMTSGKNLVCLAVQCGHSGLWVPRDLQIFMVLDNFFLECNNSKAELVPVSTNSDLLVASFRRWKLLNNLQNIGSHSTRLLAATTLRNVLGTKNLSQILAEREAISQTMQSALDEATDPWGVKVERVEVKDVRLPVHLQRAMATEAEAAREARAKVRRKFPQNVSGISPSTYIQSINPRLWPTAANNANLCRSIILNLQVIAAEGEQKASRALKEAAEVIHESPHALQVGSAPGNATEWRPSNCS